MLPVPTLVQNKAVALGCAPWVDDLPELVREMERDWSLRVGRVFTDATEALVLEATLTDGSAAVVKIPIPTQPDDPKAVGREATVLRLANGVGCVRLLRADIDRGVLLLERLGQTLHERSLSIRERHEVLCAAAERVWRPAPGAGLPTGAEKGRWLAESIVTVWEETSRPFSARAVDHALSCAARRIAAHDDERAVLVHGDVHEWNVLESPDGGFKLIDPDGLLCEAEYDLGVIMREDPVELMVGGPTHSRPVAGRPHRSRRHGHLGVGRD